MSAGWCASRFEKPAEICLVFWLSDAYAASEAQVAFADAVVRTANEPYGQTAQVTNNVIVLIKD